MLVLKNISKKYDDHEVLSFEGFSFDKGIHWIKGGNGIGKSTLFKIIAGVIPFKGDVVWNNIDLRKESNLYKSHISLAEAEPQYPPFITGKDLLNYYISIRSASEKECLELTNYFDLLPFINNKIGSYSSGMLKKLSLICALTGNSNLYLFDEPFITIDTGSTDKLYKLLNQKREEGKTILLSSHQAIDAYKINLTSTIEIINKRLIQI